MKKILLPVGTVLLFCLFACNAGKDNNPDKKPMSLADSLSKEIDDLHIAGMSKMGALTKLQQRTKQLVDSIGALPAKTRQATAPYRQQLDSLLEELNYAEFAMDKWMEEYYGTRDTLLDKAAERLKYLETEKMKAGKLKETILGGIQKADSLLTAKP